MAYEFDGEKYKQSSTHQQEWGYKIISELSLNGTERILDLGCGAGRLTAALADSVPEGSVTGIDSSANMLETARKDQHKANLTFELADINSIKYQDEFELIFSNAALHWVQDHRSLLRNIFTALKPAGVVRLNFAGAGNCANLFRVVKRVIRMREFAGYFENFSWPWYMPAAGEYARLVERAGFSKAEVWFENADREFQDKESITGWIEQPSIVPFLDLLPEDKKEKFRDLVVEGVLKDTATPEGKYFETFRRINLLAVK